MDTDRWQRIDHAFDEARRLSGEERAAYLDRLDLSAPEIAATVRDLLHADANAGMFLRSGVLGDRLAFTGDSPDEAAAFTMYPDRRLGRYRLRRLLASQGPWLAFEGERASDDDDHDERSVGRVLVRAHSHANCTDERCRAVWRAADIASPLPWRGVSGPEAVGVDERGRFYVVSPLPRGMPIAAYVSEHALGPIECASLLSNVCDQLAAAHQSGMAHGGLNAGCLLVDEQGEVHIADFGLWPLIDRCLGARPEAENDVAAPMRPPELPFGERSSRGDVFNLGVMLLELLTGSPLRDEGDESAADRRRRGRNDGAGGGTGAGVRPHTALFLAPPSEWLRDDWVAALGHNPVRWRWLLRRRFDAVVLRATASAAAARYGDAAAMGDALREAAAARPLEELSFRAKQVGCALVRWPPSPLLIATVVVLALLAWLIRVRWIGT